MHRITPELLEGVRWAEYAPETPSRKSPEDLRSESGATYGLLEKAVEDLIGDPGQVPSTSVHYGNLRWGKLLPSLKKIHVRYMAARKKKQKQSAERFFYRLILTAAVGSPWFRSLSAVPPTWDAKRFRKTTPGKGRAKNTGRLVKGFLSLPATEAKALKVKAKKLGIPQGELSLLVVTYSLNNPKIFK